MNIMQLVVIISMVILVVLSMVIFALYLLKRVDKIEDRLVRKMMNEASATSNKNCTNIGGNMKKSKIDNARQFKIKQ